MRLDELWESTPSGASSARQPRMPSRDDSKYVGERDRSWYTGKAPLYGECPGMDKRGHIRSLGSICTDKIPRQELQDHFDNTWTLTEVLFGSLQGESAFLATPAHGLRHPLIFYYGHTAAFYINKLLHAGVISERVSGNLEALFQVGVDEMARDVLDPSKRWPSVEEVHHYRRQVYAVVCDVINNHHEEHASITMDDPLWSLLMGLEHDRFHLETTSALIREMDPHFFQYPKEWPPLRDKTDMKTADVPENSFVHIPGHVVNIGKNRKSPSFGWDNEYGLSQQHVCAFEVSKFMVSNLDFSTFVNDGGYYNPAWWKGNKEGSCEEDEAFKWLTSSGALHPHFWVSTTSSNGTFKLRAMFDEIEMEWGKI